MAAGDATAADVPGVYDVVINGKGYVFADSVAPSLPFRTHRAIYDISQTFVQRQNVSNTYGDNQQDFWMTASQNDWTLGEDQRFFRPSNEDSKRRYWSASAADLTIPGQVTIAKAATQVSLASTFVNAVARWSSSNVLFTAANGHLYEITPLGAITDIGATGLAVSSEAEAIATDGLSVYISGDTVGVRRWDGTTFTTFSATKSDALAFLNNTLYGFRKATGDLIQYDSAGAITSLFTWKGANGTAETTWDAWLRPFGGQLLVALREGNGASSLWLYNGTGVSVIDRPPPSFYLNDVCVAFGSIFAIGNFDGRTTIYYNANGNPGILWKSTTSVASPSYPAGIAPWGDGLLFTDPNASPPVLRFYDIGNGGVHTVGQLSGIATGKLVSAANATTAFAFLGNNTTTGWYYPASGKASSCSVVASLADLDSSLMKVFRGIKVDFSAATDGNGGSVDIAYRVDDVDGSYTTLQTGATSGTEYLLTGITGHSISVKVTLNKGTSTNGPVLKRVAVRAAPQLQQFRSGTYILNCTNTSDQPLELRNGMYHALTGNQQANNLLTAAKAAAPFSITDRMGTFTGLVDLNDPEGFDIYEIHPAVGDPTKSGAFLVRIKVREV